MRTADLPWPTYFKKKPSRPLPLLSVMERANQTLVTILMKIIFLNKYILVVKMHMKILEIFNYLAHRLRIFYSLVK
jgi:hypothetical protein